MNIEGHLYTCILRNVIFIAAFSITLSGCVLDHHGTDIPASEFSAMPMKHLPAGPRRYPMEHLEHRTLLDSSHENG